MKDLLAFALKLKKQAATSTVSFEDKVQEVGPLLTALAAKRGVSEGSLFSLMLSDYLLVNASELSVDVLAEIKEDTKTTGTMKSGALDKLPDDCVAMALEYLDYGSRCKGVERVCHRLFHLSRAVPIHCESFMDLVWKRNMEGRIIAGFSRFSSHKSMATFDISQFNYWPFEVVLKVVTHFRKAIRKLRLFDNENSAAVVQIEFPRLRCIEVKDGAYFLSEISGMSVLLAAMRKNPTVTEIQFCLPDEEFNVDFAEAREFVRYIADCKSLRKLQVYDQTNHFVAPDDNNLRKAFVETWNVDLSHITHLELSEDFVGPILHGKVEQLEVVYFGTCIDSSFGRLPASCRQLELRHVGSDFNHQGNCGGGTESLWDCTNSTVCVFEPCKLESLKVTGQLDNLFRIYENYAPAHLDFTALCGESCKSLGEALTRLGAHFYSQRTKSLTLTLDSDDEDDFADFADTVRPFFVWLAQTLGVFQNGIKVKLVLDTGLWEEIKEELDDVVVNALKAKAEVEIAE